MKKIIYITLSIITLNTSLLANPSYDNWIKLQQSNDFDYQKLSSSSKQKIINDLIIWQLLQHNKHNVPAKAIKKLMQEHPSWPHQGLMAQKYEEAYVKEGGTIAPNQLPLSTVGLISLKNQASKELINTFWVNHNFHKKEEEIFLLNFKNKLTKDSHIKRINRLLLLNHTKQASRMINLLDSHTKKMAQWCLNAINQSHKKIIYNKHNHSCNIISAYAYHHLLAAVKNDDLNAIRSWAPYLKDSSDFAYLTKKEQHRVGKSLEDLLMSLGSRFIYFKHYNDAEKVMNLKLVKGRRDDYKLLARSAFSAIFGRKDYQKGLFYLNKALALSPTSFYKAELNYLLAKANQGLGRPYQSYLATSGLRPDTFYGAISLHELGQKADISKILNKSQKKSKDFHDLKAAVNVLLGGFRKLPMGNNLHTLSKKILRRFCAKLAKSTSDSYEINKIIEEAPVKSHSLKVQLGHFMYFYHPILAKAAYPLIKGDFNCMHEAVHPFLLHGHAKQESEFDYELSDGILQIIPATRSRLKKQLNKSKLAFIKKHGKKTEDIVLGSFYIYQLKTLFNDIAPCYIAAYNAGEEKVQKWVIQHKIKAKHSSDELVKWIEHIPFAVTRKYVKRVLANVSMYNILHSVKSKGKISMIF